MKLNKVFIGTWIAQLGAIIIVSQAISFARWNKWGHISLFVNHHAVLLAVAGVSLMAAVVVIQALTRRIEKLERVIADSVAAAPPADHT